MSRPNPFAQRDRPDSIVEADQPSLTAPAKLSNEKPRRRNPFRNGTAEQSPDTDGAFPHTDYPVDGDGNESVHSFRPLPAFRDTPRPLNSRDVCAFIVNKMVGSGIYTAPPVVLLLTKSKGEALGLWFIGFLYTLISMMIYLEFARRLPHTGGELVYLDETLPRPRLFAYTLYTFYFVLLYNTATNSMVFAQQVLICAAGDVQEPVLDQRALRFIAIVALSFFVLIHYLSGRAGRDLNQVMAFVKVLLLVIVFIAGIVRASHNYTSDWGIKPNKDASSSAIAFLYIVFSFTGWENATFVGGEIRDHQILRKGFIWAVMTVGVLYMLINFIFLLAVPAAVPTTQMAPLFFGGGYHARLAWAILIAISASGSLLSVAYTCARVKQVIGMSNVIPWSRLWKSNSTPETDANGIIMNSPTPQGGLLLHWIFSVTLITASAAVKDTSEAIHFPGNLQAYAAGWVGIFISFGFPFLFLTHDSQFLRVLHLTPRNIPQPTASRWDADNGQPAPANLLYILFWPLTILYFCFNAYIIAVPLIPPYRDGNGNRVEVKGFYYIIIVGVIVVAAIIYYLLAFAGARNRNAGLGPEQITEFREQGRGTSITALAGVHPELFEDNEHNPQYGYRKKVEVVVDSEKASFLYWLFGGSNKRHCRPLGIAAAWDKVLGR